MEVLCKCRCGDLFDGVVDVRGSAFVVRRPALKINATRPLADWQCHLNVEYEF
jgi:hypothetical protein